MQIELIRADSAPEKVVKQILKNLETGNMQPGEQLPTQEKLAEIFGVGRSSIREATNALAIMGYLKIIQGKGTFISEKLPADSSARVSDKDFLADANLFNLVEDNWDAERKLFAVDFDDDILAGCVITHGGEVINDTIRNILEGGA